jgi:glutaredoxin
MPDGPAKRDPGVPVILYSRPRCHLCDEARGRLADMGIGFDEIDIESDPRIHAAYIERIPVIEVDGREVCELGIDESAVRAAITWEP